MGGWHHRWVRSHNIWRCSICRYFSSIYINLTHAESVGTIFFWAWFTYRSRFVSRLTLWFWPFESVFDGYLLDRRQHHVEHTMANGRLRLSLRVAFRCSRHWLGSGLSDWASLVDQSCRLGCWSRHGDLFNSVWWHWFQTCWPLSDPISIHWHKLHSQLSFEHSPSILMG